MAEGHWVMVEVDWNCSAASAAPCVIWEEPAVDDPGA